MELGRVLSVAKNRPEKLLWLGALLGKEIGAQVVVVGGSAIEIYTSAAYVSGDVDIVAERSRLTAALEGWGFRPEGRLWVRGDLDLWVDAVGRDYTGDRRKLRDFVTPFGSVKLASVEDLIAKRLIEIAVWPQTAQGLFEQALMLAAEYDESLDWEYIERVCRREGAEKLVKELTARIRRKRGRRE